MTRWELRQLEKQRKEKRKEQALDMLGAILFGLVIGGVFFFAR